MTGPISSLVEAAELDVQQAEEGGAAALAVTRWAHSIDGLFADGMLVFIHAAWEGLFVLIHP